jgi:hypothetical protein
MADPPALQEYGSGYCVRDGVIFFITTAAVK